MAGASAGGTGLTGAAAGAGAGALAGSIIPGIGTGIGALIGGGLGLIGDFINYGQQAEERDYQRGLQEEIFAREDTAVQRRAADLEAAGLSRTLAAGSAAGSGAVVSTKAPQFQAANARAGAELAMTAAQTKASIDLAKANERNIDARTAQVRQDTQQRAELHPYAVRNAINELDYYELKKANTELANELAAKNIELAGNRLDQEKITLSIMRATGLQKAQAELAYKAALTAAARANTAKTVHDTSIYKALGIPTNIGWTNLSRYGMLARGAAINVDFSAPAWDVLRAILPGLIPDKPKQEPTATSHTQTSDDALAPSHTEEGTIRSH